MPTMFRRTAAQKRDARRLKRLEQDARRGDTAWYVKHADTILYALGAVALAYLAINVLLGVR